MGVEAVTVVPGKPDTVRAQDVPDPAEAEGSMVVEGLLAGVCGTDVDIAVNGYGWAPPGQDHLVLFHESLGRVINAPADSGFAAGDLVAGVVRRPDPEPCEPCGKGEWDFCRNGKYTERGIKERNGYGARTWRVEPEFAVKLDPSLGDSGVLLEPTSVVAKAWNQALSVMSRCSVTPRVALVTGAGPIGLLAAMLGVQSGLEVHVLDRVTDGPKPGLVADLGATYHSGDVAKVGVAPDVVIECTGYGPLVFSLTRVVAKDAVICLTGLSGGAHEVKIGLGEVNNSMVLENTAIVGSVNAGMRDYRAAAGGLAKADVGWLSQLVSRRVPMTSVADAFTKGRDDVKVVVDLQH